MRYFLFGFFHPAGTFGNVLCSFDHFPSLQEARVVQLVTFANQAEEVRITSIYEFSNIQEFNSWRP